MVQDAYGAPQDVLRLRDADPPQPGEREVLVRVAAASVNPADVYFTTGVPRLVRLGTGLRRPRRAVPGGDVAGVVEAAGAGVTRFRPGDAVFGRCAAGGAFAELAVAAEDDLAGKPEGMTFEQAAGVPLAGATALQAIRDVARVRPGQRVLVVGAAGGIGGFAVQLARHYGAEVTGVCGTGGVEHVRGLGAEHVVDYTREDFTAGDVRYDVILDNVAARPLSRVRRVLTPTGILIPNSGRGRLAGLDRIIAVRLMALTSRRRAGTFVARTRREDLTTLAALFEAGSITVPVGATYRLADAAAALAHVAAGHAHGKIVVVP
ncbi:NAD(P)-dependent alcohol dehydrogenase [Dactylosporangium sp. NBC_01737]|uniref:NAD(P)-dependent alcohol dehydrogenase n=1 Tax=Dactylosporangium sp. NBC_01737 TaxID=2975959 RepID=UPI002E0DCF79|nr:NAD(P)-dependent alcohol dehydrogenase [Dactylosporangium sp. NBC_01737]